MSGIPLYTSWDVNLQCISSLNKGKEFKVTEWYVVSLRLIDTLKGLYFL